jgi:Lrp/AsnC family leucine-responsive transcriptional regulator
VEIMDFSRDYLSAKRRDPRERAWYGDVFEVSGVDLLDMKILDLISRDARMSSIKIARRLEVSPNTVLKRIEAMKEKNLIIGFKPLVNLDNTPFAAYKALVKYQNITERAEKEIIDFLKADPHVLAIIRLIGLWDFEFEFEVDSLQMMRSITNRFRDRFKDVIKEFEILPLYHEYKYNFFPGDLLAR